jgi:hypothetical protein
VPWRTLKAHQELYQNICCELFRSYTSLGCIQYSLLISPIQISMNANSITNYMR